MTNAQKGKTQNISKIQEVKTMNIYKTQEGNKHNL